LKEKATKKEKKLISQIISASQKENAEKIKIMGCLPFRAFLTFESRRSIGCLLFSTSFTSWARRFTWVASHAALHL